MTITLEPPHRLAAARPRFAKGKRQRAPRFCGNPACKRSIDHKRPQAKWCGPACANIGWHLKRRVAAQLARPRCMICGDPIHYGQTGVRLDSLTCGKRTCVVKRWNWFGRRSAA